MPHLRYHGMRSKGNKNEQIKKQLGRILLRCSLGNKTRNNLLWSKWLPLRMGNFCFSLQTLLYQLFSTCAFITLMTIIVKTKKSPFKDL